MSFEVLVKSYKWPDGRPTGRTTKQMLNAPEGAHYLWPNNNLGYPKQLANDLGRSDLIIVSISWLETGPIKTAKYVVIDHACSWQPFNKFQLRAMEDLRKLGRVT